MCWMGRMDQSNTEGFIGGLVFDLYTVETRFDIHIIVRRFTALYSTLTLTSNAALHQLHSGCTLFIHCIPLGQQR